MIIGTLELELFLGGSSSLKDKRRVVKSLLDQIHRRFNVSAAEVGELESWQRSVLGVACVSNEKAQANRVLNSVQRFVEGSALAEVTAVHLQII